MRKFIILAAAALLAVPFTSKADVEDRLYDFTDAYYLENGINPALISGRVQPGPIAVEDEPIFDFQRNVRVLLTFPAYDHSGNLNYFGIMGGFSDAAFTNNEAGEEAREIANKYIEYVFPQAGTDPVGLGALRQSVLLDLRNGYFSGDPLGLWLHVWVSYTDKALRTRAGKAVLNELARKNGRDLDGTPILKDVNDIEDLFEDGYVTLLERPADDPLRYAICPVIEDPTDGGIAPDQFLAITLKPNGKPLEREFQINFDSLRLTGDWD